MYERNMSETKANAASSVERAERYASAQGWKECVSTLLSNHYFQPKPDAPAP